MFDKKFLLALKLTDLPKNRSDAIYRTGTVAYLLKSKIVMNGKLLIVTFYRREAAANGFSLPTAVLYITKDRYITLKNADGKQIWRNSRIRFVLDIEGKNKCICLSAQDEKRIRSFLPLNRELQTWESTDIDACIQRYQDGILEKALAAKKARLAKKTDDAMKVVPQLPQAFEKWIDRDPLLHSRYIYYKRITKKTAEGYCTHCKTDMIITEEIPVHNQKTTCPSCKSLVTFKAIGKSKKVHDEAHACIIQKAKNGEYLLRYFQVARGFYSHYRTPETRIFERARLLFTPSGTVTGQYKYGKSAKLGRFGWYPSRDVINGKNKDVSWEIRLGMYIRAMNVWFEPSHLYPCNLRPMLAGLNLSFDIIKNVKGRAVDATTYLMRSMVYPFAPTLWRIGLQKVGNDLLEECWEPGYYQTFGSLHARFGVSKEFVRFVREHNLGIEAMNKWVELAKKPNNEEFLWMFENKVDSKSLDDLTMHTTFHKVKTYVERQIKLGRRNNQERIFDVNDVIRFWKDYISMCKKLDYDLSKKSVLFPKSIKVEHDKVVQLIQIQRNEAVDLNIQEIYPSLNSRYYFENDSYLIRPPANFNDFIEEGKKLVHCVGANGFYNGHAEGKRLIFFIRKKTEPDAPYYTVEYDVGENHIVQCYGYRHAKSTKELEKFTEQWQRRFTTVRGDKAAA